MEFWAVVIEVEVDGEWVREKVVGLFSSLSLAENCKREEERDLYSCDRIRVIKYILDEEIHERRN